MCIVVGVVMALAGACGDDDEFDGESRGLPSARASRAASRPASGGPRDMGPPDTGPMDMGPDVRDLGPMDMGADVRDVGPVDLGPFDGGPAVCDSNADYMADELCETTSCGGVGYCRSVPGIPSVHPCRPSPTRPANTVTPRGSQGQSRLATRQRGVLRADGVVKTRAREDLGGGVSPR